MNLYTLRRDAKAALRDSQRPAWKDTLIYFCITNLVALTITMLNYLLDLAMAGTGGGLHATTMRSAYAMAKTGLYIITVAAILVSPILHFGYNAAMLARVRYQSVQPKTIWSGFRLFGRVLTLFVLMGLSILFWSCLFLIPGLVAAYRYRLAPFILIDNPEIPAPMAIYESVRLTRGHKGELLRLDLSFWYYHIPTVLAAALILAGSYNDIVEVYGLTGLPLLSYEQTLAVYAVGILLTGILQLWKLAHVNASTALFYDSLLQQEAPQSH